MWFLSKNAFLEVLKVLISCSFIFLIYDCSERNKRIDE